MNDPFYYSVAQSFTRFPGGRRCQHGPHSGEEFLKAVALPLLESHDRVIFDLTGSAGYSSGFLDEAFGELGAVFGLTEVKRRVIIRADDDPEAVETAWDRIGEASDEAGKTR